MKLICGLYRTNPHDLCWKCNHCTLEKKFFFWADRGCKKKQFNSLDIDVLVCKKFKEDKE